MFDLREALFPKGAHLDMQRLQRFESLDNAKLPLGKELEGLNKAKVLLSN